MSRAFTLGNTYTAPPGSYSPAGTGKSADIIETDIQAWADQQPVIQRCLHCPDWIHEGTALEGRNAFLEHLHDVHPDVKVKRRSRRDYAMHVPRRRGELRNADERREAMAEVERRKRTTHADGVEDAA